MATFFSNQIIGAWSRDDNYMYATLTGDIVRSGNTVTLTNMYLSISYRYYSYGQTAFSFSVNGTATGWTMHASSPSTSLNATSFNVSTSQTSATIGWRAPEYSGSFNVSFPSGAVAPSGLSLKNLSATANTVSGVVSISSWGNPGGSNNSYRELNVSPNNSSESRRFQKKYGASLSSSITVTNNSEVLGGSNIVSNTLYYLWGYVWNTALDTSSYRQGPTIVTAPSAPTITNISVIDARKATFKVSEVSSGTQNPIQLKYRYRVSGETYSDWENLSSASTHHSVTVTLEDLDSNTSYDLEAKAVASDGKESTVTTVENAFKTTKVTTTIVSQRDESSSTANKINVTFSLSFSAVSSLDTVYQYEYQYKKASSHTWENAEVGTSSLATKDLTLLLDENTTYDFRIRARISGGVDEEYGDYAVSNFTTSSYSPGDPSVSYRFNSDRTKVYVDVIPAGLATRVSCNASSNGLVLIDESKTTSGETVTFEADLIQGGNPINPEVFPSFNVSVTQFYYSDQAQVSSSFDTPYRVIGIINNQNGEQNNIIKIRVKKKDGTLTSGDYNHPFVTK